MWWLAATRCCALPCTSQKPLQGVWGARGLRAPQKQMGKQEQKQEKQQKEQEEEGGQRGGAARRRCVLLRLALALWRGQLYRLADACAR